MHSLCTQTRNIKIILYDANWHGLLVVIDLLMAYLIKWQTNKKHSFIFSSKGNININKTYFGTNFLEDLRNIEQVILEISNFHHLLSSPPTISSWLGIKQLITEVWSGYKFRIIFVLLWYNFNFCLYLVNNCSGSNIPVCWFTRSQHGFALY